MVRNASAWLCLLLGVGSCKSNDEAPSTLARTIEGPAELLWGPAATGSVGDISMTNGVILAVITHDAASSGFAASEGNLVDLAPLPHGQDHINELFLYLDNEFPRQAKYDDVRIIAAGGPGKEARVRATGVDTGNPLIKVVTDYVLEPEQHWITLETRFTSTATHTIASYEVGDAVQWGRTEHMAPGHGFDLPGKRVHVDWICGIGSDTSYALVPDGKLRFDTFNGSMWSDPIGATVELKPNETVTYVRHVVVGHGDTASLARAVASLRGDVTGRIEGHVTSGGSPVADARVWFMDDQDKIVGLSKVDGTGRYTLDLLPGTYRGKVDAPGRTSVESDAVQITASKTTQVDFAMGPPGILAWRIAGHDGRAPAVKVAIIGVDGTPNPRFGPSFFADGAENFVLSKRGVGHVPIAAGSYRVLVARGPEFERIDQRVKVEPGKRVEVTGKLERAYETPGFIATDLHQHAAPSFDSGVSLEDRALSNAAEGVEVLVSTEHNFIVDFAPVVAEQGLGRVVFPISGTEATTHTVGHFNALPLRIDPAHPRGGMIDVEGQTPRQIFDFVRGLATPEVAPFIQVNHPRSGFTGYFDVMKLDPETGRSADARYIDDFDGVEVVTFGVPKETTKAMRDWFNLVKNGRRYTATGTSDSHTITLRPVGWPRTWVCVDRDDPPFLDVVAFTESLRSGCATIGAGPFVTIRSGDTKMGQLKQADRGKFEVTVDVKAASWIGTDTLTLFVDGEVERKVPLTNKGVERHHATYALKCSSDCFVAAYVESDQTLAPLITPRRKLDPRPVALTNPIYVDVDGDGVFTPPPESSK